MSIHNRSEYINYDFQLASWDFPKVTVALGPVYLLPTFWIVWKMAVIFFRGPSENPTGRGAGNIQKHLFISFLLMQVGNFLYIITDFAVVRIPATGVLTTMCASSMPNQVLKLPYLIAFISSYISMIFPVLFCANRAIIVFFPKDHNEICSKLMKVSIPITIVLPICLTFFMIPTQGFCTQLTSPYPFGAIMFVLDLKVAVNEYTHLLTSCFCTAFTFSINITMLIKVRHILFYKKNFNRQINKNYKAELSLTIIMVSLFIPFLINGIVVILSLRDPSLIGYILSVRPIGVDTVTVFVPWAFYLTHPLFRRKGATPKHSSTSPLAVISNKSNSQAVSC